MPADESASKLQIRFQLSQDSSYISLGFGRCFATVLLIGFLPGVYC